MTYDYTLYMMVYLFLKLHIVADPIPSFSPGFTLVPCRKGWVWPSSAHGAVRRRLLVAVENGECLCMDIYLWKESGTLAECLLPPGLLLGPLSLNLVLIFAIEAKLWLWGNESKNELLNVIPTAVQRMWRASILGVFAECWTTASQEPSTLDK